MPNIELGMQPKGITSKTNLSSFSVFDCREARGTQSASSCLCTYSRTVPMIIIAKAV